MNSKATPTNILEKSTSFGKLLSLKGTSVVLYHSIDAIDREQWQQAAPADNLFLNLDYLSVVENHPPKGMEFCYLLFYKDNHPAGVAMCQVQFFKADRNIQQKDDKKPPCFFTTFARFIKGLVASKAEFNVLINGNLLLTGEHGTYFDEKFISKKEAIEILDEALNYALADLNRKGKRKLSGTLLKDFYERNRAYSSEFAKGHSFNEFTVQPNMVMRVRPEWKTFEDYTASMLSKYRVRTKRAFKKGKDFVKIPFDAAMIEANLDRLYNLYESIAENSGFNMVNLNKQYLLALKQTFPETFKLTGYYLNDELVGFYTTFRNHEELEAHFLGFDQSLNRNYQIYLNILYDIVKEGLYEQVHEIIFARTAMEIKSSVGAVAEEMYCYLRHRNSFSNKFVKPILEYLRPQQNWEARHPFKT